MKAFITDPEKQAIKKGFLIVDYLDTKGYEPVKKHKGEWLYSSPGSNEKTPSFYVNVQKNVFTDYSGNNSNTGEKGDIIRLVQSLEGLDFIAACNALLSSNFKSVSTANYDSSIIEEKKGIEILSVRKISRYALINYIESRHIAFSVADRYLKEIDYKTNDTKYFSVGFANDKGGFALRSALFKGQTMPQYFTTLKGIESDTINIFEGFFSTLSCLQYYDCQCFKNTTYVLNSLHNLNKLIPQISDNVKKINVFFDNDTSGRKAIDKLMKFEDWTIIDNSIIYNGYNDFNEYLVNFK